jgi:hypothetical protein
MARKMWSSHRTKTTMGFPIRKQGGPSELSWEMMSDSCSEVGTELKQGTSCTRFNRSVDDRVVRYIIRCLSAFAFVVLTPSIATSEESFVFCGESSAIASSMSPSWV